MNLDGWQRVWQKGFLPQLPTDGLLRLRRALAEDDPRLLQGATTNPPPLQCVAEWEMEGCDPIVWAFHEPGKCTVREAEITFARCCFDADERTGKPAECRHFLNWWDESPRGTVRRELLAEVDIALVIRVAVPLFRQTPPEIIADWLLERGMTEESTAFAVPFKEPKDEPFPVKTKEPK